MHRLELNLLVSSAVIETLAMQARGKINGYQRQESVEKLLAKLPPTEMKSIEIHVRKTIEFLAYLEGAIEW